MSRTRTRTNSVARGGSTRRKAASTPANSPVVVDDDSRLPQYTVAAVAARVGVRTATLRSWNQRYGVGPVSHRPGRHRLYSESDIAVVQHMHTLIRTGASPRSAARTAMETATPARADTAALLAAVFCFDVVAAGRILDHHLRRFGVLDTWDELVRPVFGAIEAQQAGGARCIDVEHALSWAVTRCLQRLPMAAPDLESAIILACTEHEAHTLALDALRAALAEREIGAVMLGAAVPSDAIIDALNRRSATCTVVVWSQSAATADSGTAEAILAAGARAILAGPGWSSVSVPSAHKVMSLQEALAKVAAR